MTNNHYQEWYLAAGPEGDVAVSTRIRLARNLRDIPFPKKLGKEGLEQVATRVGEALTAAAPSIFQDYERISMAALSDYQAMAMAEKRLISPEFAVNREGRTLFLKKDGSVSIMIGEEDHLRIQVMAPGFDPNPAYDLADKIDTFLDERLGFAFDERLGYLTECPTNLGTGLRASVMLHLPALRSNGMIARLAETVSKLGLTIRGAYGESSDAIGAFYQISNQITLGISEKGAINNLTSIVKQLIAQERQARKNLSADPLSEDKIWRSRGLLSTARLMESNELIEMVSNLRLGIALGMFPDLDPSVPGLILSKTGAATLMNQQGSVLTAPQRDKLRAEITRNSLTPTS